MVDIVAKLLDIKIAIYQPDGHIYPANPAGSREIFINYNGVNHFSMRDQSPILLPEHSNLKWKERLPIL